MDGNGRRHSILKTVWVECAYLNTHWEIHRGIFENGGKVNIVITHISI